MQQSSEKTGKILLATEEELFNTLIDSAHPFRRLKEILDFLTFVEPMRATYLTLGARGIK